MPTRSPILKRSESHWQTVPTISCPGIRGNFGSGSSPSTTCRSVRHTAQASTLTSSSPDFGRGTPTCWGCNGVKGLVNTIANMLLGILAVATVKTVGRGQTSSRRFACVLQRGRARGRFFYWPSSAKKKYSTNPPPRGWCCCSQLHRRNRRARLTHSRSAKA
jgi:hypothetical protein